MREWIKGIGRFLFGNNAKIENQQRPMIEPLEGRQFLSVSTEGESCTGDICIMAASAATTVNYNDVIHKYKGTIQTNLRPRPYKGMINIQKIDPTTGRVSGLVSIPFLVQNFKFALHGTVRPDGSYTFSFKRPAVSAKLTGQYTAGQHLVGNFSGNGLGRSITGTMDFHKI